MPYLYRQECNAEGRTVTILAETYEPGKPVDKDAGQWQQKLSGRAEELRYLKSAERYWYGESFGSEKRKKPA
jgi:hypothetical protein